MIRLLSRRNWGTFKIIMEVPDEKKPEVEAWALEGNKFDPTLQWKFEELSGKLIKDRLYEFFDKYIRRVS